MDEQNVKPNATSNSRASNLEAWEAGVPGSLGVPAPKAEIFLSWVSTRQWKFSCGLWESLAGNQTARRGRNLGSSHHPSILQASIKEFWKKNGRRDLKPRFTICWWFGCSRKEIPFILRSINYHVYWMLMFWWIIIHFERVLSSEVTVSHSSKFNQATSKTPSVSRFE